MDANDTLAGSAKLDAMDDDQLTQEVIGLLRKVVPHDIGECNIESSLAEDIGIDSLGSYELMMDAEDQFGIQIGDEQLANLKTIGDLVNLIKQKGG